MDDAAIVGRSDVLLDLFEAVADTRNGCAVLLVGESGMGRTTCLRAAEQHARSAGRLVLDTAGSAAETALPYAGLHRLLRPMLGFADRLPDPQRQALLSALGIHDGAEEDTLLVGSATLALLELVARHRAAVVVVDDLHWLDVQTRNVLAFVARRVERSGLVVIATAAASHGHDLGTAFRQIALTPLTDDTAQLLLSARAPDLNADRRTWIVTQSAGSPQALVELIEPARSIDVARDDPTFPQWRLPPALERAFGSRVRHLPPDERDVLLVAAVAAELHIQEIVSATSVLAGHCVTVASLELPHSLGLLRAGDSRAVFAHPLVRIAVLQGESVSRRQAAHRALGAVVEVNAFRRIWHQALGAVGRDETIAAALEASTSELDRRGDQVMIVRALERAAQLSTSPRGRARRWLAAAERAGLIGDTETVSRLLSLATTDELSDLDRARAGLLRDEVHGVLANDSSGVLQMCLQARRAAAAGELDIAVDLADTAVRRRCSGPVDLLALAELRSLAWDLHARIADARTVSVVALADPIEHGRAVLDMLAAVEPASFDDGNALSAYGVAARAVGEYPLAMRLFAGADVLLKAAGLQGARARNICVVADLEVDLGDWDNANAALADFGNAGTEPLTPKYHVAIRTTQARLAALRGDTDTALELVVELEHSSTVRTGSRYLARAQIVRGIALIAAGRHSDAFHALNRVFEPTSPCHHFREQFDALGYFAEAAAHAGFHSEAAPVVDRLQTVFDRCRSPMLATQLLYARAVLSTDDRAEAVFLEALSSDGAGSRWQRARIELAYGRWLRRRLRVTHCRGHLRSSLAVFTDLGAERWIVEAAAELDAAGGVSGSSSATGRSDLGDAESPRQVLSTQELKIATLAAQGLTNREIGQELYLSPRTVGSHLYRIFPKLGISTRAEILPLLQQDVGAAH